MVIYNVKSYIPLITDNFIPIYLKMDTSSFVKEMVSIF